MTTRAKVCLRVKPVEKGRERGPGIIAASGPVWLKLMPLVKFNCMDQ